MQLGAFRTMLLGRLNRDDCTDTLADDFISEGITRIQREVRAPFQERVYYLDATLGPIESFVIPSDYLEQIELLVAGAPLRKLSYRELLRAPLYADPAVYSRYGSTIYLRGPAQVGQRVELLYYGSFTGLASDTDTNELLSSAPDVALYAALSVAGDHFQHEKTGEWEARYTALRDGLNAQARQDELSGGPMAVAPAYTDPGID